MTVALATHCTCTPVFALRLWIHMHPHLFLVHLSTLITVGAYFTSVSLSLPATNEMENTECFLGQPSDSVLLVTSLQSAESLKSCTALLTKMKIISHIFYWMHCGIETKDYLFSIKRGTPQILTNRKAIFLKI